MSDHNESNRQTPVNPNWSDDEFDQYLGRTLSEAGRRTPTLNEQQRTAVLQALLVENARLAKAKVQTPARQAVRSPARNSFWDWLTSFLPRMAAPMGAVLAGVLVLIGYTTFGGSRAMSFGTLQGVAIVDEMREGPFNFRWHVQRPLTEQDVYSLHSLDRIHAVTPVTITLADGSIISAQPNSEFGVEMDPATGARVIHEIGETAYHITPSPTGKPKFWVESPEGEFTVKGTVFRVRTETGGIVQYTDEGVVGAAAGGSSTDVKTGEQVRITGQRLGTKELQVPRINFLSMTADPSVPNRVFTNRDTVTMTAKVYPSSVLVALAMDGTEIGRFQSDAKGDVAGNLRALPGAAQDYKFYVIASDGRSSRTTDVVSIEQDKVPPSLSASPATILSNNTEIEIHGHTDVGAQIFVDGKAFPVEANGDFAVRLPYNGQINRMQIVARDQAGNLAQFYVGVRAPQ